MVPPLGGMDDGELAGGEHGAHFPPLARDPGERGSPLAQRLGEVELPLRSFEGRREGRHRRRVRASGEDAQTTLDHAGQIELLPERTVSEPGWRERAQEVAPQPVRDEAGMSVQVGDGRGGVDLLRVERLCPFAKGQHYCCNTRTVVFICLPVSMSRALMVRIPSMFTSKVISRRAFPEGAGRRPLKRKSPSRSLWPTCSWSPWKIRIATSVWSS